MVGPSFQRQATLRIGHVAGGVMGWFIGRHVTQRSRKWSRPPAKAWMAPQVIPRDPASRYRLRIVAGLAYLRENREEKSPMSFGLYILGYLIVIGGLMYRRHADACCNSLDSGRSHSYCGSRDRDGRQSHAPKGLGELSIEASILGLGSYC